MLVCNVSLRPPRGAIAATIAEAVTAADATTLAGAIFAALVDDPAAVTDALDAYLGEIMLEAASASDTASVDVAAIAAAVVEPVTATDAPDATMLAASAATYDGLATNTVVSNGGRTVLHNNTTTNSGAVSRSFESSGKYYFEVTLQTSTTASNYLGIIISTWNSIFSTTSMTTGSTSIQLGGSGNIISNGATTGKTLGAQAVGDVYSAAIDLTGRLAWFRKNGGNWNGDGTANPATGVGGVTIAAGSFAPIVRFATGAVSTDQMTGNFGQAAFVYTAPSGFGNWPATYVANAWDFNGTSDYLSRLTDLATGVDSRTGVFSGWARRDATGTIDTLVTNNTGYVLVRFTAANKLDIWMVDATGAASLNYLSTATFTTTAWRHILASWNTNAGVGAKTMQVYVDDVAEPGTIIDASAAFDIDYTRVGWGVAGTHAGSNPFNGALSEIFLAQGQSLDLSVIANRRKFISATLKPVYLGTDGSVPLGVAPHIYMRDPLATAGVNSGTGGDFTIEGAPTTASTSPSG